MYLPPLISGQLPFNLCWPECKWNVLQHRKSGDPRINKRCKRPVKPYNSKQNSCSSYLFLKRSNYTFTLPVSPALLVFGHNQWRNKWLMNGPRLCSPQSICVGWNEVRIHCTPANLSVFQDPFKPAKKSLKVFGLVKHETTGTFSSCRPNLCS